MRMAKIDVAALRKKSPVVLEISRKLLPMFVSSQTHANSMNYDDFYKIVMSWYKDHGQIIKDDLDSEGYYTDTNGVWDLFCLIDAD